MRMRKTVLLLASTALAMLLSGGVGFVTVNNSAEAAFPGGNGKMVFSDYDSSTGSLEIYTAYRDGTDKVQLTYSPGDDVDPAFSADGKRISWTHVDEGVDQYLSNPDTTNSRNVWVMNADGTGKKWITNLGGEQPAFSPDGTKVTYQHWDGNDYELYWKNVDATGKKQITNNQITDIEPDWSPNGTRIAFGSNQQIPGDLGYQMDIFTIRPDGTGRKPVTNFPSTRPDLVRDVHDPDWSPEGGEIVFAARDWNVGDGDSHIASILADGTGYRTVYDPPGTSHTPGAPVFSPSGKKIAFEDDPVGVINRDGGGLTVTSINPIVGARGIDWGDGTFVDTTAPEVEAPTQSIRQGSVIGNSTVPVRLDWVPATEGGSGVARYQLQRSIDGGTFTDAILPSATSTTITTSVEAGKVHQFQLRAQDGVGNWSAWQQGVPFTVDLRQETHQDIAYTGTWQLQSSTTASGGAKKYASASGAKATFTFTGEYVGWVASTGPNRGKAEVWLNGSKLRTVDLYAPTAQPRKMVFYWGPFADPSSTRTLEIRPLGTKNASSSGTQVDVDAFVALR